MVARIYKGNYGSAMLYLKQYIAFIDNKKSGVEKIKRATLVYPWFY